MTIFPKKNSLKVLISSAILVLVFTSILLFYGLTEYRQKFDSIQTGICNITDCRYKYLSAKNSLVSFTLNFNRNERYYSKEITIVNLYEDLCHKTQIKCYYSIPDIINTLTIYWPDIMINQIVIFDIIFCIDILCVIIFGLSLRNFYGDYE